MEEPCIIILDEDKAISLIMGKQAFKYIDGATFYKKVLQEFIGSVIICSDLEKKEIKTISKKELYGKGFWSRFYSFILGRYTLEIEYEFYGKISIEELKKLLIESLKENTDIKLSIGLFFFNKSKYKKAVEDIVNKIEVTTNYQEILYALGYKKIR